MSGSLLFYYYYYGPLPLQGGSSWPLYAKMRGASCSSFGGLHRLAAFAILLYACAGIVTGTSPKEGYALTTMDMLTMDGAQARVVSVNGKTKPKIKFRNFLVTIFAVLASKQAASKP